MNAVRAQRARVDSFATAAVGQKALVQQLGDLVLGGEAETLRPSQQSAVLANAGAAVDAQLGQVACECDQSVTLTARSGRIPITVVSNASYPIDRDPGAEQRQAPLPQRADGLVDAVDPPPPTPTSSYVKVQSRASGLFRLDVRPARPRRCTLRLATGELSVRSTSSSVVGVRPDGRVRWSSWRSGGCGRRSGAGPPDGPRRRAVRPRAPVPDDAPTPVGAGTGDQPPGAP